MVWSIDGCSINLLPLTVNQNERFRSPRTNEAMCAALSSSRGHQQILGNCSPTSMSTMRVPPKPVRIATIPFGSGFTSPMMQVSRP